MIELFTVCDEESAACAQRLVQQSLAADGAIACFSSNLFLRGLNADRAPQLKASVRWMHSLHIGLSATRERVGVRGIPHLFRRSA
jgi:hypothetical protein